MLSPGDRAGPWRILRNVQWWLTPHPCPPTDFDVSRDHGNRLKPCQADALRRQGISPHLLLTGSLFVGNQTSQRAAREAISPSCPLTGTRANPFSVSKSKINEMSPFTSPPCDFCSHLNLNLGSSWKAPLLIKPCPLEIRGKRKFAPTPHHHKTHQDSMVTFKMNPTP